jgi:hypothetical protein
MLGNANRIPWTGMMRAAAMGFILVGATLTPATATPSDASTLLDRAEESWTTLHPGGDYDRQVAYHQAFRSQFDFLDTSPTAIAQLMAQMPTNDAFSHWGLEMFDAEYEEALRRDIVQQELPMIAAAVVGDDWSEELLEDLAPGKSFEPPRVVWRLHLYEGGWSPWDSSEGIRMSSGSGRCVWSMSGGMLVTVLMVG